MSGSRALHDGGIVLSVLWWVSLMARRQVNLHVRNVAVPNVFVGPAIAYGGIIQLLAGMWYASLSLYIRECR